MEETKDKQAQTDEAAPAARTRDEQATSSKTLGDLEESQSDAATTAGGGASDTSSPFEGSSPSPDGAATEGRADGSDTGGPM